MNINQLLTTLPSLFEANVTPLVIGPHGIGKSQAIRQLSEKLGIGFIDLRLGQMGDVGDLMGLPITNDSGDVNETTRFARPAWFPTDGKGILFLDEVNRARRDILQAVFQLVLDRRLHEYKLPMGWHVVAACNPNDGEYSVTDISDKAFQDRFCHIVLEPTRDEFFSYARAANFPDLVQAFLADQPELLEVKGKAIDLDRTPSRRSWDAAARLLALGLPADTQFETISGLVGIKAATALTAFAQTFDTRIAASDVMDHYPKIQDRVKKLAGAGRVDALNAVVAELKEMFEQPTTTFNEARILNVQNFILDLTKDLAVAFVQDAMVSESFRTTFQENKVLTDYFLAMPKEFKKLAEQRRAEAQEQQAVAGEAAEAVEKTPKKKKKAA